jgi:hypothetical protein
MSDEGGEVRITVPWSEERIALLDGDDIAAVAVSRMDAIRTAALDMLRSGDRLATAKAAVCVTAYLRDKLHTALGYGHPDAWAKAELPTMGVRTVRQLRAAGRALLVAPRLASLYVAGNVELVDLAEAGHLSRWLHEPDEVEAAALDRSSKRAMTLRVARRAGSTRVAPVEGRNLLVPKHILDGGDWARVRRAYQEWARGRSIPVARIRRPSFALILCWLIEDWLRLRAAAAKAARRAEP